MPRVETTGTGQRERTNYHVAIGDLERPGDVQWCWDGEAGGGDDNGNNNKKKNDNDRVLALGTTPNLKNPEYGGTF